MAGTFSGGNPARQNANKKRIFSLKNIETFSSSTGWHF